MPVLFLGIGYRNTDTPMENLGCVKYYGQAEFRMKIRRAVSYISHATWQRSGVPSGKRFHTKFSESTSLCYQYPLTF